MQICNHPTLFINLTIGVTNFDLLDHNLVFNLSFHTLKTPHDFFTVNAMVHLHIKLFIFDLLKIFLNVFLSL